MPQPTVQVPLETIKKLAALGKAMQSLADDMRKHLQVNESQPLNIPIPELTRPEIIPEGDEWFWSEEWLAGEREVNEELKRGEYVTFTSVDDAFRWLQAK